MTDKTTIQLTNGVKARLDDLKQGDESYNTVVKRLVEDGGQLWTENELREIVRAEIEAAVQK